MDQPGIFAEPRQPADGARSLTGYLDAAVAPVPYRIRIGLLLEPGVMPGDELAAAIGSALDSTVPRLFDDESRELLRRMERTRLAFALLTTAAASADRLAERIAAAREDARVDASFVAETERYAAQYGLLARRSRRVDGPADPRPHGTDGNDDARRSGAGGSPVSDLEDELGRFLADNCDVLIEISGTAQADAAGTVARDSAHTHVLSYAKSKGRPVITIPHATPGEPIVERGHGLNARSAAGIELYNTWRIDSARAAEYAGNLYSDVFGDTPGRDVPEASRELARAHLIPHYVRSSDIAKYHQAVHFRTGFLVYGLSVLAVALLALGSLVHAFAPVAFATELALLIIIVTFVRRAHRRRTHAKWIESRFLTERIRHGLFVAVCGVDAVRYRIPPYMGGPEPPDHWMTMTFDEIWSRLPALSPSDEQSCLHLSEFVRSQWVAEQAAHHARTAARAARLGSRLEMGGLLVFTLAIAAALGHLVLPLLMHGEEARFLEGGLTFLALVLPATGAALGGYRAHREYSRLARRSRAMAEGLRDLDGRLVHVRTPDALEAAVRRIEDWMVREVQDWLVLMGPSRLEAPLG